MGPSRLNIAHNEKLVDLQGSRNFFSQLNTQKSKMLVFWKIKMLSTSWITSLFVHQDLQKELIDLLKHSRGVFGWSEGSNEIKSCLEIESAICFKVWCIFIRNDLWYITKMVLTNQNTWFFDHQFFWKELVCVFKFFSHSYQRLNISEIFLLG